MAKHLSTIIAETEAENIIHIEVFNKNEDYDAPIKWEFIGDNELLVVTDLPFVIGVNIEYANGEVENIG